MSFPINSVGMKHIFVLMGIGIILFFFFDAVKKIILSYPVSPNRDTPSAIKAFDEVLTKDKRDS